MLSIDFSCQKNHELEYDHACDIENRHIDKGGHGRITSESGRRVLKMLSIDFSCRITYKMRIKSGK